MRCFYAIDNDERLMTIVATQIAQGQSMFGDTWASYQTSAMLMAPFLRLYLCLHGSAEGIVLAYRIISVVLSLLLALIIDKMIRLVYSDVTAYVCSLIFFLTLPIGAINADYRLLQMWFVTLSVCMLLLLLRASLSKYIRLVLCICLGLSWSCAVLCYPYLCLITVFILGIIFANMRDQKYRTMVIFLATCVGTALLFLCYIFSQVSFGEFSEAVTNILNDPTHPFDPWKFRGLLQKRLIVKYIIMFGACLTGYCGIMFLLARRKYHMENGHRRYIIALSPFVGYLIIIIGGNLSGLYITGFMGVSIGHLAICVAGLFALGSKRDKLLWQLWLFGISVYMVTVLQGNVSAKDYLNFLYVTEFVLLFALDDIWSGVEASDVDRIIKKVYIVAVLCFCLGMLWTKAFKAREVGGVNATIFEQREMCKSGPFKFVFLYPQVVDALAQKEKVIEETTSESDTILVISTDELMCLVGKGNYIYPLVTDYVDTFQKDVRWQNWLDSPYHDQITKVYLDKDYIDSIDSFMQEGLGRYIMDNYQITGQLETERLYMLNVTKQ